MEVSWEMGIPSLGAVSQVADSFLPLCRANNSLALPAPDAQLDLVQSGSSEYVDYSING